MSKRAKYNRRLLTEFTKRWKNEYLLSLLEAYRPKGSQSEPDIKVNDVFILKNEQVKRTFWKLCKVVELIKGADGSVRSARIEVISNNKGKKMLNRSLKYLIPLEIRSQPLLQATPAKQPGHQAASSTNAAAQKGMQALQPAAEQCTRPRRNAAAIGELRRRETTS